MSGFMPIGTSGSVGTVYGTDVINNSSVTGANVSDALDVLVNEIISPYEIRPAAIASNQNDYNPTDWAVATEIMLSSSVDVSISGFNSFLGVKNKRIYNIGTKIITILHDSSLSISQNRTVNFTGTDIFLKPNESFIIGHICKTQTVKNKSGRCRIRESIREKAINPIIRFPMLFNLF